MVKWLCKPFSDLTNNELYDILELRSRVFVVEQHCAYLDIDQLDKKCYHVFNSPNHSNHIVAYCRLINTHMQSGLAGIGRVVVDKKHRRKGLGKELMKYGIQACKDIFHANVITVGAQVVQKQFYQDFGFIVEGNEYLEDGIPHIKMTAIL